jgi:Zn-dependent metalloprotease
MRCCFLPPHMLRALAERGDADERDRAHASLEISAQFRGERLGAQVAAFAAVPAGERRRTIYDARHGRDLPGKLVRGEGGRAVGDPAVDEAYEGAGRTYDFYRRVFGRNSVDGRGLRLDATVHFGQRFDNAEWNGRQMIYGDGDGKLFERFTKSIDVIGHELTHGVTQYSAALSYSGEAGALSEHFSDVFGILIKQHTLKQTAAKADWLVGAGVFTSRVNGDAVRSMKAPGTAYDDPLLGKDPQPSHMRDYLRMHDDNGGVHVNSGIPNHAFYLAATALGGKAWEVAGRIWYAALTAKLRTRATFRDCARATRDGAAELYGATSEPQRAVEQAWRAVGIDVGAVADYGPRLPISEPAAELPTLRAKQPARSRRVRPAG